MTYKILFKQSLSSIKWLQRTFNNIKNIAIQSFYAI